MIKNNELDTLEAFELIARYAIVCSAGHDCGCDDDDLILRNYILNKYKTLGNLLEEIDYDAGKQFQG